MSSTKRIVPSLLQLSDAVRRIISLTSIPPRFSMLGPVLESLIAQGADEVWLAIPERYSRFPDWDGGLPNLPSGIRLFRAGQDLGPATKILPAARELRGQDGQILFCDDDCNPAPGWAHRLFNIQSARPNEAVAGYVRPVHGYVENKIIAGSRRAWQLPIKYDVVYRGSRLLHRLFGTRVSRRRPFVVPGYGDIFFGVGGVVVRPHFFDDVAFDIPRIAFAVDDIWLSAMLARKKIRIYCPFMMPMPEECTASRVDSLLSATFDTLGRQALNRAAAQYCQERFGIWR